VPITFAGLVFAATTANVQSFEGPFRGILARGVLKAVTGMLRAQLVPIHSRHSSRFRATALQHK
jgi:hypothetical protein